MDLQRHEKIDYLLYCGKKISSPQYQKRSAPHFGEHTEARTPKRPVTGPSPEKNGGAGELSTAL